MDDWFQSHVPRYFILSDDDPPQEIGVETMEWAVWFEENDGRRFIRDTQIKRGVVEGPWVSTVFIGIDMNHGEGPVPILYETGVFECRNQWREPSEFYPDGRWTIGNNLDEDRYSTWSDAMEGHERLVEKWGAKWWEDHGDQHDFT